MKQWEFWQSPEGLLLLRGWARDGDSPAEIAGRMGISLRTLEGWRRSRPAIRSALAVTREMADRQVEEALLKAALGYTYTEVKTESTDKGEKTVCTEKEVSPNVTAISLWLKLRLPEVWGEEAGREAPPGNNLLEALGGLREEGEDAL